MTCRTASRPAESGDGQSTVHDHEVDKFDAMGEDWWDPNYAPLLPLRTMNVLTVEFIRHGISSVGKSAAGLDVLDVGCGGGFVSELLARDFGARVTGIDVSENCIAEARRHLGLEENADIADRVTYAKSTVEDFAAANEDKKFDVVLVSEVLEHVVNPSVLLRASASLVKDGGSLFMSTLNRTEMSVLVATFLAPRVLRLVDPGTFDGDKFVRPEEAQEMLDAAGCKTLTVRGMHFSPFKKRWYWIPHPTIFYALHAVKT